MRPDVVIKFMDQFGDIIYNNYNATEAGMIATATPQDLRAEPDTAGKPAGGTEIRILDADFNELPTGEVGGIYVPIFTGFGADAVAYRVILRLLRRRLDATTWAGIVPPSGGCVAFFASSKYVGTDKTGCSREISTGAPSRFICSGR